MFCAAHIGLRPEYGEVAREMGRLLASEGIGVVTGGGRVGLMGEVADAALEAGGEVIGVIPRALVDKELGHEGLTELLVVDSMHERKERMHSFSDGFITLPGGMGSLDEVFEALTWLQLGFHAKPVGFVNTLGFYDAILAQLDRATEEGFIRRAQRDMIVVASTPPEILASFRCWRAPPTPIWTGPASAEQR